ncbi:MAG: hypothetical protein K2Q45_04090 [Nitrosomonas sp.]|nr:hypothetical protein [Nitrosomonas sp.]
MKHEIEIEGLPEGLEITGAELVSGIIPKITDTHIGIVLTVNKKKQPRRIVLEETDEVDFLSKGEWFLSLEGNFIQWNSPNRSKTAHIIWREVKEPAPSLHNADDKESLRLSVDQCRKLLGRNLNDSTEIRDILRNFVESKQ